MLEAGVGKMKLGYSSSLVRLKKHLLKYLLCLQACGRALGSMSCLSFLPGFPDGSVVKNLPAVQEMRVRFLSQEDPREEKMATHSSILA